MTPYETLQTSNPDVYQQLSVLEKAAQTDPTEENRFQLAVAYADLGMDAQEHQRPEDADFWCEKQLNAASALYEEYQKEDYGLLLGDASDYFALSASELNQPADAAEWISKSITVYEELAKRTDKTEAWYTTALSYLSLAGICHELERTKAEEEALLHAKDILEAQYEKDSDPLFVSELPMLYEGLAKVLRVNHKEEEALQYEEKSKKLAMKF